MNNKPTFECKRCGRCCLHYSWLTASSEDIDRWKKEGRDDILQYADFDIHSMIGEADLWIHPETGKELSRCPFLRKVRNKPMYKCRIHDTQPWQCQASPALVYNQDDELINADRWAVDNCPALKALLKDWTPERLQALRKGKMMKKLPMGSTIDETTGEERKPALDTCIWCGKKLQEGQDVYVLGASVEDKSLVEGKARQFVALTSAQSQRTIQAYVAENGSRAKWDGWDVTFLTCNLDCARSLQAVLRQATDLIDEVCY